MHSKEPLTIDVINGVKTQFTTLFGCKIGDRSEVVMLYICSERGEGNWAFRTGRTYISTVAQQESDDFRMRPGGGVM
jgi:hypothetical protein